MPQLLCCKMNPWFVCPWLLTLPLAFCLPGSMTSWLYQFPLCLWARHLLPYLLINTNLLTVPSRGVVCQGQMNEWSWSYLGKQKQDCENCLCLWGKVYDFSFVLNAPQTMWNRERKDSPHKVQTPVRLLGFKFQLCLQFWNDFGQVTVVLCPVSSALSRIKWAHIRKVLEILVGI